MDWTLVIVALITALGAAVPSSMAIVIAAHVAAKKIATELAEAKIVAREVLAHAAGIKAERDRHDSPGGVD